MNIKIFQRLAIVACAFAFVAVAPVLFSAPTTKAQKAAPAKSKTVAATYKGAIVVSADDGTVLFEDDADIVNPPASVTKLMTFLIVKEAIAAGTIALDTPVQVTTEDSKIGGTQVWLDPRETFTVEEMLHGLMIQSANDCANALARAAAGSRAAFVERMNARAKEIGMAHTTFVTPHGLPPANRRISEGDLTTPRDLAALSRYLVTHTDIVKYTAVRTRNFGEGKREKPVAMTNHNHLLGKVAGVDGLKTGFTNGAGFCLAATAERKGNRLIVVTMGSPDAKSRDMKIAELFETYFAKLPPKPEKPVSPVVTVSPITAPPPASPIQTPAAAPATVPGATASPQPGPDSLEIVYPAPAKPRKK